jgi:hypothetical protein
MRAADTSSDLSPPATHPHPPKSQPPNHPTTPSPPNPKMCFGSKPSPSHRLHPIPRPIPHPLRLPPKRDTLTTLFPCPSSSSSAAADDLLYADLLRHCQTPTTVSLTAVPSTALPPNLRRQADAKFLVPRGYYSMPRRAARRRGEQDSWHTLRQARRPRVVEVPELQGRLVPEERLGRDW